MLTRDSHHNDTVFESHLTLRNPFQSRNTKTSTANKQKIGLENDTSLWASKVLLPMMERPKKVVSGIRLFDPSHQIKSLFHHKAIFYDNTRDMLLFEPQKGGGVIICCLVNGERSFSSLYNITWSLVNSLDFQVVLMHCLETSRTDSTYNCAHGHSE